MCYNIYGDDRMKTCKFCGSCDDIVVEVPIANGLGSEWMHKHCGEKNVDKNEFELLLEWGKPWQAAMSSARYTRRRNEKMNICYEK